MVIFGFLHHVVVKYSKILENRAARVCLQFHGIGSSGCGSNAVE